METENKAVLISIKPKWCELIANGKKTVEVRKTKPAIKTPFKCYIYQSRGERVVIGEFICNLIAPIAYTTDGFADIVDCETTCMTPQDFLNYGRGDVLYGWRISDLKIYDEPIEIKKAPWNWCYVEEVKSL